MNNKAELAVEWRTVQGKKVRQLRKKGLVPGVLYGHGPSTALQLNVDSLKEILKKQGTTGLLQLKMLGGETSTAIIKQMQFDPVKGHLLHVDFLRTVAREKLKTKVPLRFVGEPQVSDTEVAVVKPMDTVTVEALPADLPSAVEVDLSRLDAPHATIRVADLDAGYGVRIVEQPDEIVATAATATREVVPPVEEVEAIPEMVEAQPETAATPEEETAEETPKAA